MKRIKYVSRFARVMSRADIDALTEQSRQNNARLDITGILMTFRNYPLKDKESVREHISNLVKITASLYSSQLLEK